MNIIQIQYKGDCLLILKQKSQIVLHVLNETINLDILMSGRIVLKITKDIRRFSHHINVIP
jgi:hypothetical protein